MTTFVAWVGVDSRGVASINFGTDSRISWDRAGRTHWDSARKTFSASLSPDIFGYVNDVAFPSMILGQVVSAIDNGGMFANHETLEARLNKVVELIKNSHRDFPSQYKESFCIFHAARRGSGLASEFALNTITWEKKESKWLIQNLEIPKVSSTIAVDGSGKRSLDKWADRWNSSSQGGTSRAVFSSFCNAVYSGEDKLTNGAPQLVSLYRKGGGKTIGYVDCGKKYISGMEIFCSSGIPNDNVEWRNKYFERCDISGNLIRGAKKHHVPKGLTGPSHRPT